MDSRALYSGVFAAVAAVMASTISFVAPAGADHSDHETCRPFAQVPKPFVKIEAENGTFDTNCLQAPADRDWRIYFTNHDKDDHNISIYTADPAVDKKAEQVFEGASIKQHMQEDYAIDALPPGKYYFQDDKVKTMNGAIVIADTKKK